MDLLRERERKTTRFTGGEIVVANLPGLPRPVWSARAGILRRMPADRRGGGCGAWPWRGGQSEGEQVAAGALASGVHVDVTEVHLGVRIARVTNASAAAPTWAAISLRRAAAKSCIVG